MRLFIAIEVGEAIAAEAGRVVDLLRRRAQTLAPRARITWVTPGRMHLTVRFIGYVDEPKLTAIQEAVARPIAAAPFDLSVSGVGTFPPRGAPRVLWAGIHAGDGLAATEHEVSDRLAALGIPREDRPYSPHLTLARVKEPAGLKGPALLESLEAHEFGRTRVGAITLFESRLSSKGPTYIPLSTTRLS